jgi:hypothetical protein
MAANPAGIVNVKTLPTPEAGKGSSEEDVRSSFERR